MLNFLTKNKKGFTLVELLVVLILLSFGVLALANMFKVTYRAFNKAEERYVKQEAVKEVAQSLRSGRNNVAAALSADVFPATTDGTSVVPTDNVKDKSYSYLYILPHYGCSVCDATWDKTNNKCPQNCTDASSEVDGYYLYVQNRGVSQNDIKDKPLSDIPMYVSIDVIKDDLGKNSYGVIITLAALEEDFVYETKTTDAEGNTVAVLNTPSPDDIYYSLDVAYHFPNMVTNKDAKPVNYSTKEEKTKAPLYGLTGGVVQNKELEAVDENGAVLRVYVDSIISTDNTDANAQVPSFCFIATASYGLDSGEVGLLCKFRDECLLTNPLGTAFVNAYYKLSPPIADFIRESEPLKAAVRVALKPLVAIATNAVDSEVAAENAPWFIMFMLCGAGATATLIKVDKRKKKVKNAES